MKAAPIDLLIGIPAHDEQDLVGDCLRAVSDAVRHAVAHRAVRNPLVLLGAHRCTDRTVARARAAMAGSGVPFRVVTDEDSRTVGDVRAALVRDGSVPDSSVLAGTGWLFTTDADSVVSADWVTATLHQLVRHDAVAAAGMVAVVGWSTSAGAHRRYQQIIRDGCREDAHEHVYGANLAIRLDAYHAVGGFRAVEHGEDQDLVDRLRSNGYGVISTFEPLVSTSGRMPGRAAHGLGHLLAQLDHRDTIAARRSRAAVSEPQISR